MAIKTHYYTCTYRTVQLERRKIPLIIESISEIMVEIENTGTQL